MLAALWFAFAAYRAAPYPRREAFAALFTEMLFFAVGSRLDWFWQSPRPRDLLPRSGRPGFQARSAQLAAIGLARAQPLGSAVGGLVIAWLAASL